jgi:hypothetical protein
MTCQRAAEYRHWGTDVERYENRLAVKFTTATTGLGSAEEEILLANIKKSISDPRPVATHQKITY